MDAKASLLHAMLLRGSRTYSELRNAGFGGEELRKAADDIEAAGCGRVCLGIWGVDFLPRAESA